MKTEECDFHLDIFFKSKKQYFFYKSFLRKWQINRTAGPVFPACAQQR